MDTTSVNPSGSEQLLVYQRTKTRTIGQNDVTILDLRWGIQEVEFPIIPQRPAGILLIEEI